MNKLQDSTNKVFTIDELIKRNHSISKNIKQQIPYFFSKHATLREPKYMWIGCSDYRVTPENILGLGLGEIFVHRGVGNIVNQEDTYLMSFIYFGLKVLNIKKVIICGHYDCALVSLSYNNEGNDFPYVPTVKKNIDLVKSNNLQAIEKIDNKSDKVKFLVDKNIEQQLANFKALDFIKEIKDLEVEGLVYDIESGLLNKL